MNIKHQAMIIYHARIFLTFKQKGPSLLRKVKLHMEPWQHWLWKKKINENCVII